MKVFITPAIDQQIFGLLVGENMMLAKSWQCIIDHCGKKLASWKVKLLSIRALVMLTSSIIKSLGIYFMSLFLMSVQVKNILESIRALFFELLKMEIERQILRHLVHCKLRIFLSRLELIFLSIGSPECYSYSLLQKQRWQFCIELDALWVKVIRDLHRSGSSFMGNLNVRKHGVRNTIQNSWCRMDKKESFLAPL
uniref:Uncharacterized protein n=1 Tax=Lactuca sativa TaxID=4236 RepID=A0A9R1V2P1_LACSA|nr:hypothetical protein LSAT_V11C700380320 [Lactuca sativa]